MNVPRFEWEDMELFHAHCEVLVQLVGWTGPISLAEFYTRTVHFRAPKATKEVSVEFCKKTDGVISRDDVQSIFRGFTDRPTCSAVYMAPAGQAGFDMVTFVKEAGGSPNRYVTIFVEAKYSRPQAKTKLKLREPRKKWEHCLAWLRGSEAAKLLEIRPEDCFLVIASWWSGKALAFQAPEAEDDVSQILVLGREEELSQFYTPTLVSSPNYIADRDYDKTRASRRRLNTIGPTARVLMTSTKRCRPHKLNPHRSVAPRKCRRAPPAPAVTDTQQWL